MNDEYDWSDSLTYADFENEQKEEIEAKKKQKAVNSLSENYGFKVTKITASYSAKKQIRQFEPIEVFMSAEAELNSIDMNVVRKAQKQLFTQTKRSVKEVVKGLNSTNS